MYCSSCGKQNPEGSKFCEHCGAKILYGKEARSSSVTKNKSQAKNSINVNNPPYPYIISISKLLILSAATFGLYNTYWFYKQKKSFYFENNEKHGKIYTFIDAIFAGFTAYNLFDQVSKAEKKIDKAKPVIRAGMLALAYFILLLLWRLTGAYSWLGAFSILPLIPVQKAINFYWENKYDDNLVRSKFGLSNWAWTIVGGLVLMLALYGTFGSSGTNTTSNTDNSSTSQVQSSQKKNLDITQSVIDINCDNSQGGSGTILTEDGIVLTNNHVISGASYCLITLPDTTTGAPKSIYKAEPLIVPNLSKQYDLAFLRINSAYTDKDGKNWGTYPTSFPAYNSPKDCDKYSPSLGDYVRIYGYPVTSGGYNLTITDGIISSFSDNNDILTSTKIDSGNSGGLAVNKDGCFLGVPSAVVSGNYQNLGVIIPSSVVYDFSNKITSSYHSSSSASSANQAFDFSCLSLKDAQMYGNSYYTSNPSYIASLYNGCSQTVKNVTIKVNFYVAGATRDTAPSDTEYVDLGVDYLGAGDAHAINGTINTPFNTSGDFNWTAQIYSADPY